MADLAIYKRCPRCETARPVEETICEGEVDGAPCNWNLTGQKILSSQNDLAAARVGETRTSHCVNGHDLSDGDIICTVCGADPAPSAALQLEERGQDETPSENDPLEATVNGWRTVARLGSSSPARERFIAVNESERQAVLTLYADGAEPDRSVYDVISSLSRDHVPEIIETGRWEGRAYEVAEELAGGALADIGLGAGDMATLRRIVDEIGRALHAFSQAGLRHRDLRPGVILVRERAPLDLVITGFGSARLSDYDLDIVSPLETTRYSAPEAVAGGVAAASDWWSLGMILLELLTHEACFEGVDDQAFLINVLTNGAPIPSNLDPSTDLLLRGLLARDRRERWQWRQVKAWLDGEDVEAPRRNLAESDAVGHAGVLLSGKSYNRRSAFALAAAQAQNWEEAKHRLSRGEVAAWVEDAGFDVQIQSGIRRLAHAEGLSDDWRLALALKTLHPSMPLVVRGEIVTPGWLLDNREEGYALIAGPAPEILEAWDEGKWLSRLKVREAAIRDRAAHLKIEIDEDQFRILLLSTSKASLMAQWDARRSIYPDTLHNGLASLIERRQTTEDDLILLLSAQTEQYRSVEEILEEAAEIAARAGVEQFSKADAAKLLERSRREIQRLLEERLAGFARCGMDRLDGWADQFRLEHHMPLGRMLVLLALPPEQWNAPPKQQYVSTLLDYFAKKVSVSALRGPIVRTTLNKTSARFDICELDGERNSAAAILNHILLRADMAVAIDPAAFAASETLERRLRNLCSTAMLHKRDTGIDGLYFGFPYLLRKDPRGSVRTRIAPVLLWPIAINPEVGNRGHASISFDSQRDEVRLNPAFEGLMGIEAAERWKEAAKDLLGRAAFSAGDVMDAFAALARPRQTTLEKLPGKDVEVELYQDELACAGVCFHLAYMGQSVAEDLRQLKSIPPDGSGLESLLRISPEAKPAPAQARVPESERYFMVDSDPSQEAAVIEAREAPGLLIEGPPGTGKSQTIVNMVADAIGRKKSLLVICQKQPALEVVRKRLEAEGLADRIVMIADINRDREPVVRAIREQVETILSTRSQATPLWKRERDQLAARIEALEDELDRRHDAIHHEDEQTGRSYRVILGDLAALDTGHAQAISAPRLRALLGPCDPYSVSRLAETCGPLASSWLPAKYEDSPLLALKPFSVDEATRRSFLSDLAAFVEAEEQRNKACTRASSAPPIADPAPYREWLDRNLDALKALDSESLSWISRWIGYFQKGSGGENTGLQLVLEFDNLSKDLGADHPDPAVNDALNGLARGLADSDLQETAVLAASVVAPVPLLGRLNPLRWARRGKLNRFLKGKGVPQPRNEFADYLAAASHELWLRPLREKFSTLSSRLEGAETPAIDQPEALWRERTSCYLERLRLVSHWAQLVANFPDPPFLYEAMCAGSKEDVNKFAVMASFGIQRAIARSQCLKLLDSLSAWFEDEWIEGRRSAIERNQENRRALFEISGAMGSLAKFQYFRIRAAALDQDAINVFSVLRSIENQLSGIPENELEEEVRRVISREARLAWKARIEAKKPELLIGRNEIASKIAALDEADRKMRNCNRQLLIEGIDLSALRPLRDWEAVTKLRGQRSRRLREFLDQATELGLMAVRPVWLMNPDVASRVLPLRKAMFDVVIYDEASQMPVEYALPTLFRARTVVVSGDEKQMPPSSFFTGKMQNDEAEDFDGELPDEEADEEERDAFEETWNRREIKDCPDLLQLAREPLPRTTLQIHYRSRYRELIAFSNASFYGDRLSVPVRHPETELIRARPVEFIAVDGVYADQTNRAEAEKVADILADLWSQPSSRPLSVGVVSFNKKQADLIGDVLEERAEAEPAFRHALTSERDRTVEGEDMRFFVKNVENVQGDERDIIIFSTTFGRNAQGTFRRFFGVLGQKGGERRLNVAVTRAREKVILLSSMPISEISDLLAARRPPSMPRDYLQGYLEYARTMNAGEFENGQKLLSNLITSRAPQFAVQSTDRDGFIDVVESYIAELGWRPTPIEDAGAFGLDFAIEDPRTGLFAIGIECDAPRHPLLKRARAREIWRPRVLGRAIPFVHRVSSQVWLDARDEEKLRLKRAIETALTAGESI